MIKTQIELEKRLINKIRRLEDETDKLKAKLFLAEMMFDTEKHAKIAERILGQIYRVKPLKIYANFSDIETQEYADAIFIKKMLENHVEIKKERLRRLKKEIKILMMRL